MTDRLKALWLARSVRERWLLGVMLGLVALVLVWLAVLRPLSDMLSAARRRHGEAVAALAEARSQAAEIAALERDRASPSAEPIDAAVAAAASAAGFQLSGIQPEGPGRVSLAIGAAKAQALFGWIDRLEAQGYIVQSLTVTSNPDRTLSARIVLRARSG
jgi:general secretion pathway protein M